MRAVSETGGSMESESGIKGSMGSGAVRGAILGAAWESGTVTGEGPGAAWGTGP